MPLLSLFLTLCVLTGCYRYVPLSSGLPEPGSRIAARLTDAGTADLARLVGPGVGVIEGRVLGATEDELTLGVLVVRLHSGIEHYWKGERIVVPRSEIAELRERRLSRGRSLLSAGTLMLAAAAAATVLDGGGSSAIGGGGGKPGPK